MSTFKSSGYRSWSTRTFPNPVSNDYDLSYVSRDRSRDGRSGDGVSQGTHLRLHLITNSRGLIELDLRDRELTNIPMEVFLFPRLEVLRLSQNHCEEIPLAVSRLRSLKYLYLEENQLLFLPETLSNCINLVEINLTKNKLPALPTNIGMLRNLRVLKIGQNDFECLPHEIGMLDNLRYLDIHSNRLWYLPFSISKLHKLKYLNLANNRFEHLPLPVCKIASLRTLTLRGNNLMNLLPDFDNLRHLQELNVSYNRFEVIPQSVFRLKNLSYINLTGNRLQSLPTALTGLKSLKVIHAQGNKIAYLPETFPNLLYLNVSYNKLFNFSVAAMKQLKSLNASNNFLENIPMGTYSLSRIQSVRLNSNQIRYVSPDIVQLRRLRTLDLGNNKLTSIPHVLQQLDRLDYFNVRGNAITDKIHLRNGDINVHSDMYRKRHSQYSSRRQFDPHHRYNTHDGGRSRSRTRTRSKSRGNSTVSRSFTLPWSTRTDSFQKMWDSEDLLQNGFSERHLETNSNSAYMKRRTPRRNRSFESLGNARAHKAALLSDSDDVSFTGSPVRTTDYQLLGICNQVEMLLNKQLLHPVLSLKGHHMGKSFSEKSIVKTPSGLWRINDERTDNAPPGLVAMTTETFTVTPQGGWLTSSYDANISIFLPPNAVSSLTQAFMKILKIQHNKFLEFRRDNRMVSNIINLGPIVYLKNLEGVDFNHQVTITIPAPSSDKRGHLHLLTIRDDNSCIPSSSGYQHKNGYIVLRAWNLAGKAAVITRAKCKYKACKSMEQLLNELTLASTNHST